MTHLIPTRRNILVGGAALTLTALAAPRLAFAASHAKETASIEGVARRTVGEHEVIAFLDGRIALEPGILSGASDEEIRAQIEGSGAFEGFINAFVVRGPDETVLVDAGAGQMMGDGSGRLDAKLTEAGIEASSIGTVLLTHLHPDHIGGLLGEGELALPDARAVVHEREAEFWRSDENKAAAGEGAAQFFDAARAVLDKFGDRMEMISGETDVAGGLRSMELFGHTPGHTGFMLDSGGERMLVWGDIIHVPPVQLALPDVTIAFDVNPDEARATRARVLDMAATDGVPVAGMHLVFPAMGQVVREGEAYGFETMG